MTEQISARRSARVLLVDGAGRLLLLQSYVDPDRPSLGYCWFTPGGGVDDGETLVETAVRELHEEVGLAVTAADLGEPVAWTGGYADLGFLAGLFRDTFFHYRVNAHDVDTSGQQELERSHMVGHHWWTLDELRSPAEPVYPFGLVPLLTDLIAGRVPARPVQLPWHH